MFHVPGNILNSIVWLCRVMFHVPGNILNSIVWLYRVMFPVPGNTQTVQFDYTGLCSLCQAILKQYSLTIQSDVPCARHYSNSTVWLYRVMFPVPGNTQTVQFDYTEWCSLFQVILKQYSLTIQGDVPCARQYSNSTVWLYRVMFPVPGNTQTVLFDYTEWCSLCQALLKQYSLTIQGYVPLPGNTQTVQFDYTGWCSLCQAILKQYSLTIEDDVPCARQYSNSTVWLYRVMFPVPGNT